MSGNTEQTLGVNLRYEQLTGVNTQKWFPLAKKLGLLSYGHQPREVTMQAGNPDWEKLKKIRETTYNHLVDSAQTRPNLPFVQIEGIGYVEVPASVAAPLTDTGVNLGTPFSSPGTLEPCNNAFKYIRNTFGLEPVTDNVCIMWAGTAKEGFDRLKAAQTKSRMGG